MRDLAYEDAKAAYDAERDEQAEAQVTAEIAAVQMAESHFNALVACEMFEIADREGAYHVNGVYYANEDDADRQRQLEAERRVRTRIRAQGWESRRDAA